MHKPKYYLKPWHMVKDHHCISKGTWEDIRKQNNKPYCGMRDWYAIKDKYYTWNIKKDSLTQRLFIEEKEK